MKKIKTIFERNWDGDGKITTNYTEGVDEEMLKTGIPTEKLDGQNVRVTVRSHKLMRLEKRRNPSKLEKAQGIDEPWYVDADEFSPNDKYMWEAARNTNLTHIPDGEWSGECLGKDIQGNPLNLPDNRVVLFSCNQAPIFIGEVPTSYYGLQMWLPAQKSLYGNDCGIEGIVWHMPNGDMYKIKTKDFV